MQGAHPDCRPPLEKPSTGEEAKLPRRGVPGGTGTLPRLSLSTLCSLCMFCRLTRIAGPELCKCMHGGALTSGPVNAVFASGSRGIASAQPLLAAGYQSPGYGGIPQSRGPSKHFQAAGSSRRSPQSVPRLTAAQAGRKMEVRYVRDKAQGSGYDRRSTQPALLKFARPAS